MNINQWVSQLKIVYIAQCHAFTRFGFYSILFADNNSTSFSNSKFCITFQAETYGEDTSLE